MSDYRQRWNLTRFHCCHLLWPFSQVAVRWCTSCDDPFCFDCWTIIHLRGRRVRHAYCEIDGKGQVGARAIGPSGEDAGNFKAGQAGTGYSSDYGTPYYSRSLTNQIAEIF